MGRIPESVIEEIKHAVDIVEIIGRSVKLKSAGRNYLGLCPFHNEKTPSFTISPDKGIFHCFGCGEGGDVISFVMKHRNMSYPEAIRFLAQEAGIRIEGDAESDKSFERRKRFYEINSLAGRYYFSELYQSAEALAYLKRRGISPNTAKNFGLGYAPRDWDGLLKAMEKEKVDPEELATLGLVIANKQKGYFDRFRHRIMFPILNRSGKIIGFGGRALGDDPAKYLNSPESELFHKGQHLYALNFLENKEMKILLVEGYMDVISLHQHDLPFAVASLGTALTQEQAILLAKYKKEIYICYDSDKAGILAAKRAIEVFREIDCTPQIMRLEQGMDPDDFIRHYGKEAFQKAMDNALLPVEFELSLNKEGLNFNLPKDRILYLEKAKRLFIKINRKLIRDEYIKRFAKEMDLDEETFKNEVESLMGRKVRKNIPMRKKERKRELKAGLEEDVLRYAMESRAIFDKIKGYFTQDILKKDEAMELADFITCLYDEKDRQKINMDEIIEHYRLRGEMSAIIDSIARKREREKGVPEKAVDEMIMRFNRAVLEGKKQHLLCEIELLSDAQMEEEEKKRLMKELLTKMHQLDIELKI